MRILVVYRHYWPDATPYARLSRAIAERLATRGCRVTVLTGQPSYSNARQAPSPWKETLGGVEVKRVRLLPERKRWRLLRGVNFIWFLLRAVAHACVWRRYDLVIANSHPPIAIGVALRVIRRLTGTPFVLHLQDLHPEAQCVVGALKPGWRQRLLLSIETANCRAAERVVTLSDDMRHTLLERRLPSSSIRVVNNCALDTDMEVEAETPAEIAEATGPTMLFAGNLGRFQSLPTLVDAMRLLPESLGARLVLMGSGAVREELVRRAHGLVGRSVFFVDQAPVEIAAAAMRAADLGIVSLAPGMTGVAYPSKALMYLTAGCPLLAVVDPQSSLADTVRRFGLGTVAEAPSAEAVASAMAQALASRTPRVEGERGRIVRVADSLFGRERMLRAWEEIISELDQETITLTRAA
ncbi:glycosyltransferase family 4 protein [Pirellulimonas nuda]|uniref:glycosyltransferase family 4 protein n=1 Tax=Pirellulimonas nuda TaxID=2528009 RepID=UPI0018D3C3F2|nr:glycosyltransferase family 4 protein [Pirellulimonas nuda]